MSDHPRIDDLRRRVQKDPASIAFAQLAEEHRRLGEYREAVEVCRAGLATHPTYLSARVTLGRALLELGELGPARQELQTVLAGAPDNLSAVRGLAEIHHREGALAEALALYRRALGLARNDPDLEQTVADLTREVSRRPVAAAVPSAAPTVPAIPTTPKVPPALADTTGLLTLEQLAQELEKQAGLMPVANPAPRAAVSKPSPAAALPTSAVAPPSAAEAVPPVAQAPAPAAPAVPVDSGASDASVVAAIDDATVAHLERWLSAIDGYRAERRA